MNRIIKNIFSVIFLILITGCAHFSQKLFPYQPLPLPVGEHGVGTAVFHWIDSSREEWFSEEDKEDVRELMVQVWYPGKPDLNAQPAPYMDNMEQRIPEFAKQIGIPEFMLRHFSNAMTNSYFNLEPINGEIPVIIFSHGLGGMRTQNTAYIEMLASKGYFIAAMDHPFDANITIFPDGRSRIYASNLPDKITDSLAAVIRHRQLETRSSDVSFVIDQLEKLNTGGISSIFTKKLSLEKIGIFGHSFGGATSIHAAFNDKRIAACLTLDPWYVPVHDEIIQGGITTPFLHIGQPKWKNPLNYEKRDTFIQNSSFESVIVSIAETFHFDYMDMPLFTPATKKFGLTGKIDPILLYTILNRLQLDFFNSNIRGTDPINPNTYQNEFPYLTISTKKRIYIN